MLDYLPGFVNKDQAMRYARSGILFGLGLVLLCVVAAIWFDGGYLPNKPCRPIRYPDANQVTVPFDYTITEDAPVVLSFFNAKLNPHPYPGDTGEWVRQDLGHSRYLYSCVGIDINGLTGETGCIYIRGDGNNTLIRTTMIQTEGGGVSCPQGD